MLRPRRPRECFAPDFLKEFTIFGFVADIPKKEAESSRSRFLIRWISDKLMVFSPSISSLRSGGIQRSSKKSVFDSSFRWDSSLFYLLDALIRRKFVTWHLRREPKWFSNGLVLVGEKRHFFRILSTFSWSSDCDEWITNGLKWPLFPSKNFEQRFGRRTPRDKSHNAQPDKF